MGSGPQVNFFFHAEDGIRDVAVTGVQTCALPIWLITEMHSVGPSGSSCWTTLKRGSIDSRTRSEERRVGKECRCAWTPEPLKKKYALVMNGGSETEQCPRPTAIWRSREHMTRDLD